MSLQELFDKTGGPDPNSAALVETAPSSEFLQAFKGAQATGANGSGPILNANAVLIPTRADQYRDSSGFNDFRLGNGVGVSRSFRKPDSMGGAVKGGFNGPPVPNKMFGRSTRSHDMNFNRDDHRERAQMALKKMGYKDNEVPKGAALKPWVWNDIQALGIGTHGNQYNRNHVLPDADATARRLYEPAPSRRTKMLATDVECAALRPNSTRMHPMTVVTNDRQRMKDQRIPRNADVAEAVVYENIFPRGMQGPNGNEAHKVWGEASVLRQPVGNNETGDKSALGIWRNGHDTVGGALHAESLEDTLQLYKDDSRYVRGQDVDREAAEFRASEKYLNSRTVADPNLADPRPGEYPRYEQDINGPLAVRGAVY